MTTDTAGSGEGLDHRLVATSRGDAAAFAHLYDEIAPRIHGLVHRILRGSDRSEGVTQDVFLEIWRTSQGFDPRQSSALGWVMSIAHRFAVAHAHTVGRRSGEGPLDHGDAPDTSSGPFGLAVSSLTPAEWRAIELSYFGGYTHGELTAAQSPTAEPAKTSIRTGLLRLGAALSHDDGARLRAT